MRYSEALGPADAQSFVGAGVDQLVVDHQIAALRQGGEQCFVGGEAARKPKRPLAAKEGRRLILQRFVFRIVAPQQARSARTDRDAAVQRFARCLRQQGRAGQSQIIVRGEVRPGLRRQ